MRLLLIILLASQVAKSDERVSRLAEFMDSYGCRHRLSSAYVKVADQYGLDYRLLPAISVVESSCGRFMRGNNLFGWNSGRARFKSPREAVERVSKAIGSWGLDTEGVLKRYNPSKKYPAKVLAWMERINVERSESSETASRELERSRQSNSDVVDDSGRMSQDQGSIGVLLARPNRIQACSVPLVRELQFSDRSHSELP